MRRALLGLLLVVGACSSGVTTASTTSATPTDATTTATQPPTTTTGPTVTTGAGATATTAAPTTPAPTAVTQPAGQDWPTYHRDLARDGVAAGGATLGTVAQKWKSPDLDGDVYGEPLVAGGRVIAATQNNTVYSLDAATGAIQWSAHFGDPVPRSSLPCGNVDPTGVLSTPVIDPAAGVVYAVAFLPPAHHELYAVELTTGQVRFHRTVDAPGADPRTHQQRASLSLFGGHVYIPYGGLFGDCGDYHGRVVSVPADGNGDLAVYVVPVTREGAIWATGGAATDGDGNLYVTTGNGESQDQWDRSDGVVKLSSDLKELDAWGPTNWQALSAADADLASLAPVLLDGGLIFTAGKEGVGYLLDAAHLGGVGGELFKADVCGGAFGTSAYQAPYVYVPCSGGLVAVKVEGRQFRVAWKGPPDAAGSPIVAGGQVWVIDWRGGVLYGLDPASGAQKNKVDVGEGQHFITPSSVNGVIYVGTLRHVVALG